MAYRLGVDIGGAFTDLVGYDDETGDFLWVKGETTPKNPAEGVLNTIRKSKLNMSKVSMVLHGQTLVINSIITRDGAKVGLLTTKGHRDILILQRANRRDIYNFRYKKPEPFVPRYLTIEVRERIGGDGSIIEPLHSEDVRSALERLLKEGVESICISFLNVYANPVHEIEAKRIIQEELEKRGLDIPITTSHEITREWYEYERTNTAVLNAFVKPKMKAYLNTLEKEIKSMGFKGMFYSMLSNGGMASFDFVKEYPIYAVESGPIAGIIGGIAIAELIGEKNVIVLDGGSTTTKASLVENLTPKVHSEYHVGRDRFNPGYPVKVPVIEIEEVGNGGTSIAWIDAVGNLRVGPQAMGADPGPACYGKGGDQPTVTDAYVINGLINPNYLLGGEMKIYRDLAVKVVKEKIADYFNISVEEAAEGIIKIANENAANAIRIISVQKGYDPRDFILIAHGGSGPMFAPFIAQDLEINKIVIPAIPPGVFSAWGMLLTDIRHDVLTTYVIEVNSENLKLINESFSNADERLFQIFEKEEGILKEEVTIFHYADMRYKGQEHTVKVPVKTGELTEDDIPSLIERFHQYHERAYDFRLPESPVQIVNFHSVGIVKVKRPKIYENIVDKYSVEEAIKEDRKVFINGDYATLPVFDRQKIPTGVKIDGPAILEDPTSTVLVLDFQEFVKDNYGNIIISTKRR
ncbi:hydantoinase/oxoprolinase family protein [Thermococcus sp. 2319x1]|uniref:hydantoinase/oxoprolinase family protein n=1 Tax=Thermococcus sp. 2319x1 TaxID=1674923 RepID=UPI0015828151|nr:hydantoinase/oxoprolinase family protein [Thermococcus sp. 2319x1]